MLKLTNDNTNDVDLMFQQAMASVTEQAAAGGLEQKMAVMTALFPLFLDNVGDHDGEDLGL